MRDSGNENKCSNISEYNNYAYVNWLLVELLVIECNQCDHS